MKLSVSLLILSSSLPVALGYFSGPSCEEAFGIEKTLSSRSVENGKCTFTFSFLHGFGKKLITELEDFKAVTKVFSGYVVDEQIDGDDKTIEGYKRGADDGSIGDIVKCYYEIDDKECKPKHKCDAESCAEANAECFGGDATFEPTDEPLD